MYLSKSKYCKCVQCNKILWLDKYKNEVAETIDNESVLDNGTKVGNLAKGLFGKHLDVEYSDDLNKMIEDTKKYLENKNCIITEASFNYNGNFCSVDILKKNNDKYEIYEVKSSSKLNPIYMEDASYQYYVLKSLGLDVSKVCIVHINDNYVKNGELELDKLFKIEDITEYALGNYENVKNKIDEINTYMNRTDEEEKSIDLYCFKPYKCPYFQYCSGLEENNVFDLRDMSINKKIELYKNNLIYFRDLFKSSIADKYKEQIDYEINDKEDKINKQNIIKFMKGITYPLYFLDFETYQVSIPEFDGVKPYEQIPFQYSLHYIKEKGGEVFHTEFLGDGETDPRRALAEKLVSDIPSNVCVLAYKMSFEKTVIKKLANTFPDLKDHLMKIHNNMKDLMVPFQKRDYYTKNMHGSYSIKYVLPALFPDDPSLDYHNLDMVHNGREANETYSSFNEYSEEELKVVRENMLKYCELDTYAMVKIYKKLDEIK